MYISQSLHLHEFVRLIRASVNCPLKCLFALYMLYLIRYHIEKFPLNINEIKQRLILTLLQIFILIQFSINF